MALATNTSALKQSWPSSSHVILANVWGHSNSTYSASIPLFRRLLLITIITPWINDKSLTIVKALIDLHCKAGSDSLTNNCRPISIAFSLCNVLEQASTIQLPHTFLRTSCFLGSRLCLITIRKYFLETELAKKSGFMATSKSEIFQFCVETFLFVGPGKSSVDTISGHGKAYDIQNFSITIYF